MGRLQDEGPPRAMYDLIKRVLQEATGPGSGVSQRSLGRAAGLGVTVISDIISGKNTNPTIGTLAKIADAMGTDLSVFGLSPRPIQTTLAELQRALGEALPAMPSPYLGVETQARYLAEVVAAILELPDDLDSGRG
jgi:transcriptional regulator with XRE-family HTH domain